MSPYLSRSGVGGSLVVVGGGEGRAYGSAGRQHAHESIKSRFVCIAPPCNDTLALVFD